MFGFKLETGRLSVRNYTSALFGLSLLLLIPSAHGQICQGSIASGATITPSLSVPVHIGDMLNINLVDVANQAASVRCTNTDLYIILPDGSTNHVATSVNLAASATCGDADGPGFFGCPGPVTIGAFTTGTCIPYPGTYVVRFVDIHRPLAFAIVKGGITAAFGNNGGAPKQVQFLVAAAGQAVNGDTPSAGPVIPRTVIFPCISITKECDNACTPYGQPIFFHGVVTNSGDSSLTGIVVSDTPPAGSTSSAITFDNVQPSNRVWDGTLAAGESAVYHGSYTPPNNGGTSLCGPFTDTISATAVDAAGKSISNLDPCIDSTTGVSSGTRPAVTAVCHVSTTPGLALTKDCFKTGSPGVRALVPGDTFVEVFTLTNTGNVPLTGVTITDVSSKNGTTNINVGSLDIHGTTNWTIGPFPVVTGDCPSISDSATAKGTNICPADASCSSSGTASAGPATCSLTVTCAPCIGVSKLIACGPCGSNPAGLTYGPTATGVAGTNNPAFCYQIIVTNCGAVTLTNVQVSDPTLGLTFTLPTNLPPDTATAPIFTGTSLPVGDHTNTVTATGQSQATGQTVTTNASAVAIVVPASVTCKVDLSSPVNQNTNNSPPCEVTLPPNSVNSPVTVKLTINNTGQADLNVSIIGGNILTSGLVNCTSGAAVTFGNVFVPAGGTTNFVVGCVSVSCPGTNISAVVQGTAVASKTIPCVLDLSGNDIRTATSSCNECVNCLSAPPCIQVSKLIACGPCSANPAGLTYGPTATGVAGTNNPAFCYQIVVTNCGGITLTNVRISDPTLGLAITLPTNLPPGTATAPIFQGASFPVGTVTNTVTATGQSQATGQTVTSNAKAVAIVVPASVTCKLDLSSSLDLSNSPNCEVQLPANTTNAPVTVTITINNTGQADLDVHIIGGDVLTSALFDCDFLTNVTFGTVFVPAGGSTNFVLGCVAVSCPGTNISAVVQGTAVASKTIPCILDTAGNDITTAPSQCSQCVDCASAGGLQCRVTGGGTLQPGAVDTNCVPVFTTLFDAEQCAGSVLDHISHGGQLGAPFNQHDCGQVLGDPCIRGQWQHTRHYQGTGNPQDTINVSFHSFNANNGPLKGVFDTLECACLGCCSDGTFIGSAKANALCNPDDHKICGPEPRPAPANAIIFTGLGVFSPAACGASGKNQPDRWFVFRVYIEDRSEPGGLHPGGAKQPADVYCFQAWDTGITVIRHSDASTVATTFRSCLGADSCAFIESISTSTPTGVPPGTLPSSTVCGMPADIVDCGPLYDGNQQIHPSTGATCTATTPLTIIP
jgi:uncharacterized repeat protein (TIGR01451 family)